MPTVKLGRCGGRNRHRDKPENGKNWTFGVDGRGMAYVPVNWFNRPPEDLTLSAPTLDPDRVPIAPPQYSVAGPRQQVLRNATAALVRALVQQAKDEGDRELIEWLEDLLEQLQPLDDGTMKQT